MTLELALLARAAFVRPDAEHLRALLPRFLTATRRTAQMAGTKRR
jgi:hypothetical protein